jgi:hypothetical protein
MTLNGHDRSHISGGLQVSDCKWQDAARQAWRRTLRKSEL